MMRNPTDKLIQDDAVPRVAMQVTQGVLVVPVQIELYEATLNALREDILGNIRRTGVRQALIDLSAVEVMDSYAYGSICDTATMAKVMGTQTVLTGIKAGVASVLVEFDVNVKRVAMALNLEAGLAMLAGWDGRDNTGGGIARRSYQFDGRRWRERRRSRRPRRYQNHSIAKRRDQPGCGPARPFMNTVKRRPCQNPETRRRHALC